MHVLITVFCVLALILMQRLFVLQIVDGKDYLENYTLSIRKTKVIQGTRGNIYDRDGEILATNRMSYSVEIEDNGSYQNRTQKNEILNETIAKTIALIEKCGDSVVADFGITLDKNDDYQFVYAEGTKRLRFLADVYGYPTIDELKEKKLDKSSPQEVMDFLCANKRKNGNYGFGIEQEEYGKELTLKLVTIRYGMHLNSFQKYISTTIASDVSDETVAVIKENMYDLQGVSIGEVALREYPDSKYFAPIIGYTGKISQDEYDALSEKQQEKYSLTDIVGKTGIEQVMDEYLQGEKGEEILYVSNGGKVLESESITEPKAGNDLYLTIDKDLQITAYNLMEEKLAGIILRKMANILDYTRDPNGDADDIIIPIGDIYYSFIGNEILDTDHFAQEDATKTEKSVYAKFSARQETAIQNVMKHMSTSSSPAYKDLSKEMQAYTHYIATMLGDVGVLQKDKINVNDKVYTAWKNETINLNQYLNHAISMNWVDASVIQNYLDDTEKYSDSNQLYQGILNYLNDRLKTDASFEKLVYRYMVKDGSLSGNMICVLLFDQKVLEYNESQYNQLLSGGSAYNFIRQKIESLEITPGQLGVEPSTGSVVMTETGTGNTLVCVSYPGYDNNRLANQMDVSYYNQVYANTSLPFYNKATQELTAPGSTFKPLSAIAGLTEDVISSGTYISCNGPYKNITPSPTCWIHPGGHGSLNVIGAISNSCNCYFYEVGYRLGLNKKGTYSSSQGISKLDEYAKLFGLGETSGLEISERTPNISTEDSVRSSIGQGTHVYSTSQLAKYISGVANRGTVYDLTLLDKVVDQEGKTIKKYKNTVYNKVTTVSDETYDLVHQGMIQMVAKETRFQKLRSAGIELAGKTGTAQQSKRHANTVLFVGFAPSKTPEIALSIRITNGYSSSYPSEIGRDLTLKYFNVVEDSEIIFGKAGILGAETHGD